MSSQMSSLSESLRHDQQERWSRGERVLVESYLEQHPQLADDQEALLELIEAEYALRLEHGEQPSVAEYASRFPRISPMLPERLGRSTSQGRRHGDTDGDQLAEIETKGILCPFCQAEVPLLDAAERQEQRCPQCARKLRLADETVSVRAKPGRYINAFELVRRLGAGHYGEVWLARDTTLRRDVALKLPRMLADSPATATMFLREARAAAKLRHANIVPVYETGSDDDQPYIVSAFIQGTNLAEVLRHKQFSPDEAARLCQTLAAAVHHAHQSGVVHRDLKPSNVLIDVEGTAFVADFGLASNASIDEATITRQGDLLGTPAYMSPEQARGEADKLGPHSDVYALGVILYELLTGRRPFDGNLEALLYRILTEEPVAPRKINKSVPADLETICLKAMAKSPADRYATAQDLADDLRRYLAGEHILAKRPGLMKRVWRKARRVSPAMVVLTLICITALAALGWNFQQPPASGKQESKFKEQPKQEPAFPVIPGQPEPPSDDWTQEVLISTVPPGATVVVYPLDFATARPQFAGRKELRGRTPLTATLSSGQYLVVAYDNKNRFHEVIRSVPRRPQERWGPFKHETWKLNEQSPTVEWLEIKLFEAELKDEPLTWSDGIDSFQLDMTAAGGEIEAWRIPRFGIQVTEVLVERQKLFGGPPGDRPGNFPSVRFSWDDAMAWAEAHGLRLPDLVEAEFLATNFKQEGDDPAAMDADTERPAVSPMTDRLMTEPPILGISSGAREWTLTRSEVKPPNDTSMGRRYIVRGGPMALLSEQLLDHAGRWASVNQHIKHETFGVRCARSPKARLKEEDFLQKLP